MTVWPPTPLSPVLVQRCSVVSEDGALQWRQRLEAAELPDEWVLRQLFDADLDSDEHVLALLDDGVIWSPFLDPSAIPMSAQYRLAYPFGQTERNWWRDRTDGTLEDARWWLKSVRALVAMWREVSLDGNPASPWAAEGFSPVDQTTAWVRFQTALAEGLRPYHARVEYAARVGAGELALGVPQVSLYEAACAAVFNLVLKQPTARRCENETCGRVFVHQLGGAKFRQHRSTGLRFCTPECARAEASRRYRRRKAARKEQ
jgi:hypothetical protein